MKGIEFHIHRRKRSSEHPRRFPRPHIGVKALDRIASIAGIIGPLMTVPQIYDIYHTHAAAGVSISSWLAFGLLDIPFIAYGMVHKDRLIFGTYILWCIANLTVALGAILYH